LRKTPHLLFYKVDVDTGTVVTVAAWSAMRGEGPRL
jgi:hypothetical protein